MIPTPEFFECDANFWQWRHGNKGYLRDEKGVVIEPETHMGYTWYYRCVEFPRLVMVDHIMHPAHDRENWREWHVDGEKCASLQAACSALLLTPRLTLFEYVALLRMGEFPVDADRARDMIAGCVNPTPGFIDGQWSRASQAIDRLVSKGIINYENGRLVRL